MKIIKYFIIAMLLQGCSQDEQTVDFSSTEKASLAYSSPKNLQAAIAIDSIITLLFTHKITDEQLVTHVSLIDDNNTPVSIDVERHPANERMLNIIPEQHLSLGKTYTISFTDLMSDIGAVSGVTSLTFTTLDVSTQPSGNETDGNTDDNTSTDDNTATDDGTGTDDNTSTDDSTATDDGTGTDDSTTTDDGTGTDDSTTTDDGTGTDDGTDSGPQYDPLVFQVMAEFPGGQLPFLDFSVLHLTLSHDIDPSSIAIDDGFSFIKAGEIQSVAGHLLVKGKNISFDPDTDLEGGAQYTLSLSNRIKSKNGLPLNVTGYEQKLYIPENTYPHLNLVQKIDGIENGPSSEINGLTRNSVTVNSKLIGNNVSYAQGNYHTELAYVDQFPNTTPFTIRKGSVIRLSSMDVNVGGEIPAGYSTEDLYLTLISDAVGYLTDLENGQDDFSKKLTMVMDTSMIAQNPQANGALSQDLLNITLGGIAKNENGVLVVDAIADIEVALLGLEKAKSTATFYLEAYADQPNAPLKEIDNIAPALQHWVPGDSVGRFKLNDAILLTFTEGLEVNNLADEIHVYKNSGEPVDIDIRQDGSVLIIKPAQALSYGTQYEVVVSDQVKDMAGNPLLAPLQLAFETLSYDTGTLAAPLVSSAYPGYNCRLTEPDYANNIAGRCSGGASSDDKFSIFQLPQNRDIQISFSQLMDPVTIHLGSACDQGSFRVEKIDPSGHCLSAVAGTLETNLAGLRFVPAQPLEKDTLYRYTLNSNKTSNCLGYDDVLCSQQGLPLNPKVLKIKLDNLAEGGNPMRIPFYVIDADEKRVYNPLRQLPNTDVNRNFIKDSSEQMMTENTAQLAVSSTSGMVSKARLGCQSGSCPEKSYIYLSGNIPSDVGEYDAENNRIPVTMYPQALMTTSVTLHAYAVLFWLENPTGPQVMRMRPSYVDGKVVPATGYIVWDEALQQAMFQATMRVYLDAPGLKPEILGIELDTNMHSLPLSIDLYGPVTFLADGRMEIQLKNTADVPIHVDIGGIAAVGLSIAKHSLNINLISNMLK